MSPRIVLKTFHDLIVQRIAEGKSTKQIARELSRPHNSITAYCSIRRIYGPAFIERESLQKVGRVLRAKEEHAPVLPCPPPPPRPSMYSLAEFDPVIRRALARRLYQRGEGPRPNHHTAEA